MGADHQGYLPGRRAVIAAGLAAAGAAVLPATSAFAAPGPSGSSGSSGRRIPDGYGKVDPRTADRVPLTLSLRTGVPLFPGDPAFTFEIFADTRTPAHDDGGFLLEHITSLGTHTASHISAPVHFIIGGKRLNQLNEDFTLMPLAVLDVRARIKAEGPDFLVRRADLLTYERRHGRIPAGGCVLLLTGYAPLFNQGNGEDSPYITTPAPGFAGDAVDWLFGARRIIATGSDTLGPDATMDLALQATTRTLFHGGITLENVGTQLPRMRPHGDWIAVNGNRPAFSGFQMGFTGFTVPRS
ncbi:MAG TPA: cyclase family protein [Mycobacteriales bacterium]|nr:cyclase family protein [Mycobacteriales bacterium]